MTDKTDSTARRLRFEIFRYNPEDAESKPHIDTFEIDERPYMTLYMALSEIRETQDPGLQFDFACRSAICGSCGMMVNGRPALGCRTLTRDLPETIRLHPLPAFKLIGDLSVDTGTWFREMAEPNINPEFLAAAGLNRVARFMMDPRDTRTDADWFEVVAGDQGVFGCVGMMACADVCPKELPLLDVYAYLRRRTLGTKIAKG